MPPKKRQTSASRARTIRYAVVGLGHIAQVAVLPAFSHARRNSVLGALVSDALRCSREDAAPLSRLIHEKTGGNPFFAIQILSALHEELRGQAQERRGRATMSMQHQTSGKGLAFEHRPCPNATPVRANS